MMNIFYVQLTEISNESCINLDLQSQFLLNICKLFLHKCA